MKTIIVFFLSVLLVQNGIAQIDTAFWFAAPDVSESHGYDRPIYLRVTAYQQPCVVKIFEPANPAFPVQTLNIPASTTQSIDLTPWIDILECKPGDVVQNFGLKIVSDNRIAAYYEANAYGPNPELFALKGRNALGKDFYISSQYILNNSPVLTPLPISSFNIVATEDNTSVTITPTNNIVGHMANTAFVVTLNKGQVYAAIATSQLAANHLQGSKVTANKPIAITLADDLLQGIAFGGPCEDLAGDQTVPTDVLGTEYIAIKGNLNGALDKLYITATVNGTTVSQDGVFVTTLNAGQSKELTISNPSTYIQTSLPAYVYQLTGVGCEVGSAVLPKITCTGSSSVSVARSSDEPLKITLLVPNGGQNSFLLNNTSGIITAANFSVVPATGGQWYFAKIDLPLSSYPNNTVIKIDNASKLFQMGFLQGGVLGAAFGYFSDYNALIAEASASSLKPCTGTNVNLYAQTVASASYSWTGPSGFTSLIQNPVLNNVTAANAGKYIVNVTLPGCGTYIDSVTLTILPKTFKTIAVSICEGDSYFGHTTSGTYLDTYTGSNTCDSIRTVNLTVKPRTYSTINKIICEGQSYLGYTTTGIYKDTFINSVGCDSVRTLNLTVNAKTFGTINQSICEGQSYLGHTTTGVYKDTILNINGCDSIRTLNLTVNLKTFGTINQVICEGQSYLGHTSTGVYKDTILNVKGCDSIRTLNLTVNAKTFGTINQSICEGQAYLGHTTTGVYKDTITNVNGCDSIRTLNLTVKERTYSTISQKICEGESYLGYSASGTYKDTLKNVQGCDSIRTLNLTVNKKLKSSFAKTICKGETFQGFSSSGTYNIVFTGSNGCDSTEVLTLTVQEPPVPYLGADTAICNGDVITITPGIYDKYLWQDGSVLDYYKVSKPGIYSVVVSNQCGTGTDEILVDEKNCSHTYFPNVFTPNNDNINDYFKILNAYHISEYYLQIFNRWGEKVFETKDYTAGWNGTYHNKPSEGGNYVWYCKFKQDGKQISMKGNVILLR